MKYELTNEKKEFLGRTLYRIRAVKDFELCDGTIIHAGELGGWIEKEYNLSQEGSAWVSGKAQVFGKARVFGDALVFGDAQVSKATHYLVISPVGSRNSFTTFYHDVGNDISVRCGCFCGKLDAFLKVVKETHGDSKHGQVYKKAAELARLQIELEE